MSEREKIVAWLKREAERLAERAAKWDVRSGSDVRAIALWESKADWCRATANDIERGEHLKRPEPTIPASEWMNTPSVGH